MSDTRQSLSDLANLTGGEAPAPAEAEAPAAAEASTEAPAEEAGQTVAPQAPAAPLREQQLDMQGRAYATGRL